MKFLQDWKTHKYTLVYLTKENSRKFSCRSWQDVCQALLGFLNIFDAHLTIESQAKTRSVYEGIYSFGEYPKEGWQVMFFHLSSFSHTKYTFGYTRFEYIPRGCWQVLSSFSCAKYTKGYTRFENIRLGLDKICQYTLVYFAPKVFVP